jgi:hypothetical protein
MNKRQVAANKEPSPSLQQAKNVVRTYQMPFNRSRGGATAYRTWPRAAEMLRVGGAGAWLPKPPARARPLDWLHAGPAGPRFIEGLLHLLF